MQPNTRRSIVEQKICKECAEEFKSLGELADSLNMNKNTLRAHYLYPMVKNGALERSVATLAKNTAKYRKTK